ncbi:MAG TPA: hypothetical protein VGL55_08930 [Steroidobacteraceae bacterium]|jgi:hypothetical protein
MAISVPERSSLPIGARDAIGTRAWEWPLNPAAHMAVVFLIFTCATAAFFWQWLPNLSIALIGPPEDNMQDLWNTWYAAFAPRDGSFFYTHLLRFPEGTSLLYHSFAYPQVLAVALLTKVFNLSPSTLLLQQNLSLLASFPLAGTGAYFLVRHFISHAAGALLGGFVFAFSPSHVEHVMHHAHVSQVEFIPFFVLAYLLAIERKSLLWLGAAVALFVLNALSCWYYLFYIGYFMVFHTLYIAIRERSLPWGWRLAVPLTCVLGVIALLSPLLVPMVSMAEHGASVYERGTDLYVANVFAYWAFPPFHLLGDLSRGIYARILGSNEWEATVYLGLVNLLALAWLAVRGSLAERRLLLYVLCGMLVFCIFASGDSLHVLRHRVMPMPDVLLSQLPFFRNVRTPARAIVFVYLFLGIGVGCAAALAWSRPARSASYWLAMAAAALIVLDFYPARELPSTALVCSPGLRVIRDDPEKGFGVLDLPRGQPVDYYAGNLFMFQQACHGRPIAEGNTSRNVAVSLRDHLQTGDLDAQREQLARARVKYIVINQRPMGIEMPWYPADGQEAQYLATYPVVYAGPELTVLRVY